MYIMYVSIHHTTCIPVCVISIVYIQYTVYLVTQTYLLNRVNLPPISYPIEDSGYGLRWEHSLQR